MCVLLDGVLVWCGVVWCGVVWYGMNTFNWSMSEEVVAKSDSDAMAPCAEALMLCVLLLLLCIEDMDMDMSMIEEEEKEEAVDEDDEEDEELTWRDCVCLVANSSSKLSRGVSRGFISTEVCGRTQTENVVRDNIFKNVRILPSCTALTKLCPIASSSARLSS